LLVLALKTMTEEAVVFTEVGTIIVAVDTEIATTETETVIK
jgi:chaperonin cofactor prefoldin